jgi:hypothetical protein
VSWTEGDFASLALGRAAAKDVTSGDKLEPKRTVGVLVVLPTFRVRVLGAVLQKVGKGRVLLDRLSPATRTPIAASGRVVSCTSTRT